MRHRRRGVADLPLCADAAVLEVVQRRPQVPVGALLLSEIGLRLADHLLADVATARRLLHPAQAAEGLRRRSLARQWHWACGRL